MRLLGRARPVSPTEHEQWFATVVQGAACRYFAVETVDDARHVGNVWFWDIDARHQKAELRIVIGDAAARGIGLGTEVIEAACRVGFERLGLRRVYAYVLANNARARRAFERAGFRHEGTLRDDRRVDDGFLDADLMARIAR